MIFKADSLKSKLSVSVIIVTWNALEYVLDCLKTLHRQSTSLDLDIWVVDNASIEPVVETVHRKFPSVHIIANEVNRGFAKACNQALHQCQGKIILFLNPDTQVHATAIEIMATFLLNHSEIGALTPRIINSDGSEHMWFLRPPLSLWWEFLKEIGFLRFWCYLLAFLMKKFNSISRPVCVLTGCCLMTRRATLEEIGYFDESFFLYGEDIDLSLRLKDAGYQLFYLSEAKITHHGEQSSSKIKPQVTVYSIRSKDGLFRKKHLPIVAWIYRFIVYGNLYFRIALIYFKLIFIGIKSDSSNVKKKLKYLVFVARELKRTWNSSEVLADNSEK